MGTTNRSARKYTVEKRTEKAKELGDLIYADVHAGTNYVHDKIKEVRDHFSDLLVGMRYEIKHNDVSERIGIKRKKGGT